MALRDLPDPQVQNQDAYDDLVVAIEASEGVLSLLIAVCDDSDLREEIIERYEAELEAKMRCYHVQLDREEPSLRRAIEQTVRSDNYLQQDGRAVFTVLGADALLRIHLRTDEPGQTQLEKFLGYLQWTREGLREFRYPIVLWVTYTVLTQISTKSPDFWSWRKGVFRFISHTIPSTREMMTLPARDLSLEEDPPLSIEDLQNLIASTQNVQGINAALLASLYEQLAQLYKSRIQRGEASNIEQDFEKAVNYFKEAIALETELGLKSALVNTLTNLGLLYQSQSKFQEAIRYHKNSLAIAQQINDRPGEANSLGNLGNAYHFLGKYQQAIKSHQQSLEIKRNLGDRLGEANSLIGLGTAYNSLGQHQLAIEFYQQALEIKRDIADSQGEASTLNNLGNVYCFLGQYSQAIESHQQSLTISRQIGNRQGESNSLINLGNAYYFMKHYLPAIECYQQALEIKRTIGDRRGQADALSNLGATWSTLKQISEAVTAYRHARSLYEAIGLESEVEKVDQALQKLAAKSGG
ncbi:MAG TPA: tetratricopeptide repeat protein [Candidatus Obscuribacterales bacterium]